MLALLAATLIWSFSFGIIKQTLAGIPADWLAFLRLAIAGLVFLPFAWRAPMPNPARRLLVIGGVQFGLMYVLYMQSYAVLAAWEVALFTAFTPIWVLLIDALLKKGERDHLPARVWIAAVVCVAGAWLIRAESSERPEFGTGFLLVQGANLCFAFGQVAYRRWLRFDPGRADASAHAWIFLGGACVALLATAVRMAPSILDQPGDALAGLRLDLQQLAALAYLGVVAAGFGFYLWNAGARRVSTGRLATMNNLKVPSAVAVSVVFFGESLAPDGDTSALIRKLLGAGLVLAAVVCTTGSRRSNL